MEVVIDEDNCYTFVKGRPVKQKEHVYRYNMFGDRLCCYCWYAPDGHKAVEEIEETQIGGEG